MHILSAEIYNFRCFKTYKINFNNLLTLITGSNGIGKTSFLEALHYSCYMRSFKTHVTTELINNSANSLNNPNLQGFSIQLKLSKSNEFSNDNLNINDIDDLHVSLKHIPSKKLNGSKRTLKFNNKSITSCKELYTIYKVVTIIEDDLNLIKGSPSIRRSFLDQLISLIDSNYVLLLREHKKILSHKNSLLFHTNNFNKELYMLWNKQLYNITVKIQSIRRKYISLLQKDIEHLNVDFNNILNNQNTVNKDNIPIDIEYIKAKAALFEDNINDFDQLIKSNPNILNDLMNQELRQKRSVFGVHLDDYTINFKNMSSKTYASRGQQKRIIFILKAAQLKLIDNYNNSSDNKAILLIDDFITDFDEQHIQSFIRLLSKFARQIIITSPLTSSPLINIIKENKGEIINL